MCIWLCEATRLEQLKQAEDKLIELAKKYGDVDSESYEIVVKDTPIPFRVLPLKKKKKKKDKDLYLHSICARATDNSLSDETKTKYNRKSTPLVMLPGYQLGAMYFYRNLVGLTSYFETVYSLELLGCGLSSRRPKLLKSDVVDKTVKTTEALFVESIEAWRKANGISKMILGGHSLGAHIAVAYCEKYPQHVEQLLMLSPAGVTHPDTARIQDFFENLPWSRRMAVKAIKSLFNYGVTPAQVVRSMPLGRGRKMVESHVKRRMPRLGEEEQLAMMDYLYYNAILPGTGELMLNRLLTATSHARIPTVDRIPKLQISHVSFLYGTTDWMDTDGGVEVLEKCKSERPGMIIDVFEIQEAGHLLMTDNWRGTHAGIVTISGGGETIGAGFPKPRKKEQNNQDGAMIYFSKLSTHFDRSRSNSMASVSVISNSSLGSA